MNDPVKIVTNPLSSISPDPKHAETLAAISSRARDLSLSITNPATLSRKLRESLVSLVGIEQSTAFHIAGSFDGTEARFEIAYLGPNFVSMLGVGSEEASVGMGYKRTTSNGWEVNVGVAVSARWGEDKLRDIGKLAGMKAEFSVTIAK